MRALCEGCGQPQPPDWKAGDLCSFCGKAVRRDVRCYWCAKWVPAAKFCRSCGAAVVEERLYGAARMLKDAGTDRFTIPKQLREFDPDQIENFSRIYQRHAIAVARHVDELRFLERFLRHKHWSAALEDQLIPQLPWPEEALARMSAPPLPAGDDLATAKAIQESTPFESTQSLARLARLRLNDWPVYKEAVATYHSPDPTIRAEAALALTSWRVLTGFGRPRELDRSVVEELQKSPFKIEAAVQLALLGREASDLLREALASPDRDTAFGAALVLGDVDRLQAALQGDELQKIAAGRKLVELGVIRPVVEIVEKSPLEIQRELVESLLRRKQPAPEAAEMLLQIVETTEDETLRERAARIVCRQLRPEWVLRIARAAKEDRHIYQSLLQAELPPEAARELGDFLIANGRFRMSQYGLSSVAENGRMADTFVPARFAEADPETQGELLRFAEIQLQQRGSEDLHRFVMNVVFGPHPAKIRAGAWWVLHRWYRHQGEHRGEGPLKLDKDVLARFFGSVGAFLPKLASVLRDHDTLKEVGYFELMAHVLNSADGAAVAAIQAEESACDGLVQALVQAVRGDYWPNTIEAMIKLLSQIGCHPRWRAPALDALRSLNRKGNYYYDKALRRLELSAHGIPEESEWNAVPIDFVPGRFRDAGVETQGELLKLADHQLVHHQGDDPDPSLLRFLLDAALRPGDPAVRAEAMRMHQDRARGKLAQFPLRRDAVEHGYGSFSGFVPVLTAALRETSEIRDDRILEFLAGLFSDPKASDAEMIAAEGEAGQALIEAMLALAEAKPAGPTDRLRRNIVRHFVHAGNHHAWRDQVAQGLERLRATPGCDLASDCERALRQLRPPEQPRPVRSVEPERAEQPPPSANPWVEKQHLVEKMGKELQETLVRLMAGPATPEEKMREAARLSQEYQTKVKQLYL